MPLMPVYFNGRVSMVDIDGGQYGQFRQLEEEYRRGHVAKRRLYYEGSQYDDDNDSAFEAYTKEIAGPKPSKLPEHLRKHAYSTQIQESLDFIADQLSDAFEVEATDAAVQKVIDETMDASDGMDDGVDDVLRDSLIAGDVAVFIRWDAVEQTAFYEFWESETVEFRYQDRRTLEKVIRTEIIWVEDEQHPGEMKQVTERVEYELETNPQGQTECSATTFWDDEEGPRDKEWLGVPEIPWQLLRADTKQLRGVRGESLITGQAMETADRYNAVEQVAFLISRYNSHGNLAVIGDAATLQAKQEERISKDVADVLTFPGGTALETITLPTDAAMITHQREVLGDHLYAVFGLTRVDQTTIGGLGGISGYALEILNRKTEGTFKRIRKNWGHDLEALFQATLDFVAYKSAEPVESEDEEDQPTEFIPDFNRIDPEAVYPNREIEIRFGSGYIVDAVTIRDDFNAKLISREEALRRSGLSEDEIKEILEEMKNDPTKGEESMFKSPLKAGSTINNGDRAPQEEKV